MSEIAVGCDLRYEVQAPSTFHFIVGVKATGRQSVVSEQLFLTPHVDTQNFEVGMAGNRVHRVRLDPCELHLHYEAIVNLDAEVDSAEHLEEQPFPVLPPDVLPYLNPSRYCESDVLGNFAMSEFGSLPQGYSRVKAICDWTFKHLAYVSGSTDGSTSACDVLLRRQGVCRDFAHLSVALCRALNIPARYVSGYAVDLQPPDFHGFFEAYLGERWYLFDATRLAPLNGLIRIAAGHDAADVPFATLMGAATLLEKNVWARPAGNQVIQQPDAGVEAISTA